MNDVLRPAHPRRHGRLAIATVPAVSLSCALLLASLWACGGGSGSPPVAPLPAGEGYDDVRVLSRDDCVSLRDHQIEIAVTSALSADGGAVEAGLQLQLEAELRGRMKAETDAWLKRCAGRALRASDLRCLRDATTPAAFNACGGDDPDAALEAALSADVLPSDASDAAAKD